MTTQAKNRPGFIGSVLPGMMEISSRSCLPSLMLPAGATWSACVANETRLVNRELELPLVLPFSYPSRQDRQL